MSQHSHRFRNSRIDFFTSGSTGEMKRVEKSLTLFEREAAVLEQMWGAELGDVPVIGTVTHQHVFGMTFRIMWPMLAGRPFHSEFHVAWEPLMAQLNGPSMIVSSPGATHTSWRPRASDGRESSSHDHHRRRAFAGRCCERSNARSSAAFQPRFSAAPKRASSRGDAARQEPVLWQPLPSVEVAASDDGVLMLRSPHASAHGWCEQADRISFDCRRALSARRANRPSS